MSQTATRPAPGARLRGFSSGMILVLGVLVIPIALGVIFNSYDTPDAAAFVRMACAQVAGATIAIGTAAGLFIQRIVRRSPILSISWFGFLALVIIAWQASALSSAADTLLVRLGG